MPYFSSLVMLGDPPAVTLPQLCTESLKQSKKVVKRVPKGTSAYQAAWILDKDEWGNGSEEEEEEEEEEIMEEAMAQDGSSSAEEIASEEEEEEDYESMTLPTTEQAEEEMEEEAAMLEKYRQEREEEMFPDEVDTPRDVPARVRFQKFRGLKSFRTSPWDPKENLPRDYARIFQFQDFWRTRKHVFRQLEKEETDGAQKREERFPMLVYSDHLASCSPETCCSAPCICRLMEFGCLENYTGSRISHRVPSGHRAEAFKETWGSKGNSQLQPHFPWAGRGLLTSRG
ncbi:pre-rRNA-processing protein TSR1 homolog [Vipera latastei]